MSALGLGPAVMFTPADRPERYAKALERADAVILDLEDAVTPDARPAARDAVRAAWDGRATGGSDGGPLEASRVVVRVNPAGTKDFAADVAVLAQTGWRTLMLAKAESAAQVDGIVAALGPDVRVVALCETAAGVLAAAELAAHPNVGALMWGAEDLVASMGGSSSRTAQGHYRSVVQHARATVLLAAAARGVDAWDAVHLDLGDEAGLAAEAEDAVALGCAATVCLHPRQVPVVRSAYTPSADAVARARAVLTQAQGRHGAFEWEGAMVDEVVLAQARAVLRRAEAAGADRA